MVNAMVRQRRWRARPVCTAIAVLAAGCQAPAQQAACPLPGQMPMTALKLYFGRDIPGGGHVTDQAWSGFADAVLTPAFPDGFTAYAATGQWRNPQDGRITREDSFVVETVGLLSPARIATVTGAYRTAFHQSSVGEVSHPVCAAF